jgi:hypothetical protein
MLGHPSVQQTQRYLNVTDEELWRGYQAGLTSLNGGIGRVSLGDDIRTNPVVADLPTASSPA